MYYTAINLQPDAHEVSQPEQYVSNLVPATAYRAPIPVFKLLGFGFMGFGWASTPRTTNDVKCDDESNQA